VSTPQNPEDEPVGDELADEATAEDLGGSPADAEKVPEQPLEAAPDQPFSRAPDDVSAEDALWRAIVDNYGDRPELDEADRGAPPSLRDPDRSLEPIDEIPEEPEPAPEPEDHFVPPPPPPLPTPPPARLLAWVGLFGVPLFVLVALVAGLVLPPWLGLVLMFWFVGGFVFLVASMRPGPGSDHDDGARL
jgi:hypothetical protein